MNVSTAQARVMLIGTGGYGAHYADMLLELESENRVQFAALVDPTEGHHRQGHPLNLRTDIPSFSDLRTAISEQQTDVAIISSPIAFHAEQMDTCVKAGLRVLVEKPLCAGSDDIQRCRAIAAAAQQPIHVGFQLSYTPVMRQLKQRILAGDFGAPLRMNVLCSWPRQLKYYQRNGWAGQLKDRRGAWVLDSPANNACAHFLFNALWLLGASESEAAETKLMRAQLARAYPISSADTTLIHARCNGIPIAFAATHADPHQLGPQLTYQFDKARIVMNWPEAPLIQWNNGISEQLADVAGDNITKLLHLLDPEQPVCASIEAACQHAELIADIHQHEIKNFSPQRMAIEGQRISVAGLHSALSVCVENGADLSDDWFAG